MKKLSLLSFIGLSASVLAGCPIFPYRDSQSGLNPCSSPYECFTNETCGSDGYCHSGDCTQWGCYGGYACTVDNYSYTASCEWGYGGGGAGGTGGGSSTTRDAGIDGGGSKDGGPTTDAGRDGGPVGDGGGPDAGVTYCGKPSDCKQGETCGKDGICHAGDCTTQACIYGYTCNSSGACAVSGCEKDSDCTTGSICLATKSGGKCTAAADQCFDQSQCDTGDKCVNGKCQLGCASDADCRDGFACDTTLNVCSKPVKACSITSDCNSASLVCVEGACAPRSTNGTCSNAGDVSFENGCIPNEAPNFKCNVDGQQDSCASGSVCLHHSCWISCDTNKDICSKQAVLNQCKSVTSLSVTYHVCGSDQNLGGQCDPTAGVACPTSQICIDGFCR